MCLRLAKDRQCLLVLESVKYMKCFNNVYWWKDIVTTNVITLLFF